MTCEHCGAPVRDEGAFCSHCGGRVRRPPAPAHRSAVAPERFDLVVADRGYAAARAHKPASGRRRDVGGIAVLVFGILATAMATFFHFSREAMRERARAPMGPIEFDVPGIPSEMRAASVPRPAPKVVAEAKEPGGSSLPLFFVPGVFVILGVVLLVRGSGPSGPVTREVRVVADERVSSAGRGALQHHATLQDREGQRVEYACEEWLAGRIAAGDIGVAFLRGKHLVDFIRFEV